MACCISKIIYKDHFCNICVPCDSHIKLFNKYVWNLRMKFDKKHVVIQIAIITNIDIQD